MGAGKFAVIPMYSMRGVSASSAKPSDWFELHLAVGVKDGVDLRARYAYAHVSGTSVSIVEAGPKFRVAENRVAVYLPVGTAVDGALISENWRFGPTVRFTHTFDDLAEATVSGKGLIWFTSPESSWLGASIGLGLHLSEHTTLHPEMGFMKNPGHEGIEWVLSVGLAAAMDGP